VPKPDPVKPGDDKNRHENNEFISFKKPEFHHATHAYAHVPVKNSFFFPGNNELLFVGKVLGRSTPLPSGIPPVGGTNWIRKLLRYLEEHPGPAFARKSGIPRGEQIGQESNNSCQIDLKY